MMLFTRPIYPDNRVGVVFLKLQFPYPLFPPSPVPPLYKAVLPPVYFMLTGAVVPVYTTISL